MISCLIDLHSHLLPGLDDGCSDIESTLITAQKYVENGFSTVVATPHHIFGTGWASSNMKIQSLVDEIQKKLTANDIPLTIKPGMEIALSDQFWEHFDQNRYLPLGESNTYLIEFPFQNHGKQSLSEIIEKICERNKVRFLIAHPERCESFQNSLQKLSALCDKGCLLQVNFGSILGWYGRASQTTALKILERQMCHTIATDCHGNSNRGVPNIIHQNKLIAVIDKDNFLTGLNENPQKILSGEDALPLKPEKNLTKNFLEKKISKKTRNKPSKSSIISNFLKMFK